MEIECADDSSSYLAKLTLNDSQVSLRCNTKGQKVEIPHQEIFVICEDPKHYCKAQNPCNGKCGSRFFLNSI